MSIVESPQTVVRLDISNVKRLSAVHITPGGDMVIIGGRNAQGKSSVLDSIMMALVGGKSVPDRPIHDGAKSGEVTVETQDLIITRRFTPSGGSLKVAHKAWQGAEIKKPQAMLDKLFNGIAFDPLNFAQQKRKEQGETLRALVGLDFSDLDDRRTSIYSNRSEVNRKIKELSGWLSTTVLHPDVPGEEVSVTELMAELDAVEKNKDERGSQQQIVNELRAQRVARRQDIERTEAEIARLQSDLARMKQSIDDISARIMSEEQSLSTMPECDDSDVRAKIAGLDETNRKVRENAKFRAVETELADYQSKSDGMTDEIKRLDEQRVQRIASVSMPVDGLAFDEDGTVTYNGFPLEQASSAETLRVSVAIAVALNPAMPVMLVREGAFLDRDSLRLLGELAEENGAQVWVERVTDDDPGAIIIEDGTVFEREVSTEEEVDDIVSD
jgi:DNA repair exonuclease SbcCD ATPase subunit